MNNLVLIGLGLGGRVTSQGMLGLQVAIKQKFGAKVTVLVYVGERMDNIVQMLLDDYRAWNLIIGGYSWGADNTSVIADRLADAGVGVSYLFAIQPSIYYPYTALRSNVAEALCVYNPYWFETMGLGFVRLALAPGNTTTKLTIDANSDSHPYVQSDPGVWSEVLAGIGRAIGG